jgi:hypothetical protein
MRTGHRPQLGATLAPPWALSPADLQSAALLGAGIIILLTTSAAADDTDVQALKREIQELKRQQQQQQQQFEKKLRRLETLVEKDHAPARAQQPKVEPAAFRSEILLPEREAWRSRTELALPARGEDAPKTEIKGAAGVKLKFGGFIEAAGIYRNKDEATDIGTAFQRIPFGFQPQAHFDEILASARQSRVQGLAEGDIDANQHLAAYIVADFLGAAGTANSNESNSYNPRLREAYATYDDTLDGWHWLAGQSWSMATMFKQGLIARQENIPLTIDAQYVPGFDWLRNPEFRLVKDWDKTVWLGLEAANPEGLPGGVAPGDVIATVPCISQLNPAANCSLNFMPDVTAKLALDPGWGHYELFGLARGFRDHLTRGENDSVVAFSGGGGAILPILGKDLQLQGNVLFGHGIGRYTSSQLADFTYNADGTIAPLKGVSFMVGATSQAIKGVDLYVYAGQDKVYPYASGAFGYGNPNFPPSNNSGCNIEGSPAATCTGATQLTSVWQVTGGFWDHLYDGEKGIVQWGVQDSYTVDAAPFAINGGSAHAALNTTMVSFRYYPKFGTLVGTSP